MYQFYPKSNERLHAIMRVALVAVVDVVVKKVVVQRQLSLAAAPKAQLVIASSRLQCVGARGHPRDKGKQVPSPSASLKGVYRICSWCTPQRSLSQPLLQNSFLSLARALEKEMNFVKGV